MALLNYDRISSGFVFRSALTFVITFVGVIVSNALTFVNTFFTNFREDFLPVSRFVFRRSTCYIIKDMFFAIVSQSMQERN